MEKGSIWIMSFGVSSLTPIFGIIHEFLENDSSKIRFGSRKEGFWVKSCVCKPPGINITLLYLDELLPSLLFLKV